MRLRRRRRFADAIQSEVVTEKSGAHEKGLRETIAQPLRFELR
jgi:hypothetical protein